MGLNGSDFSVGSCVARRRDPASGNMDLVADILEALLMRRRVAEALGRIDLLNQNRRMADVDE